MNKKIKQLCSITGKEHKTDTIYFDKKNIYATDNFILLEVKNEREEDYPFAIDKKKIEKIKFDKELSYINEKKEVIFFDKTKKVIIEKDKEAFNLFPIEKTKEILNKETKCCKITLNPKLLLKLLKTFQRNETITLEVRKEDEIMLIKANDKRGAIAPIYNK